MARSLVIQLLMIHLDTSFLINAFKARSTQARILRSWIAAGEALGMSAVAWPEFVFGVLRLSYCRV